MAALRVLVVTGALLVIYATAPLDQHPTAGVALRLCLGLLAVVVVLALQLRAVTRSPHPTLRGVEAVAMSVTLLVVVSASAYVSTEHSSPGSFSESMSRIDAAYFSVTVLTTVGFGDISPASELARVLVTLQMLADLVLGGFIAKVLVGAVRRRRNALEGSKGAVDDTNTTDGLNREVSSAPDRG